MGDNVESMEHEDSIDSLITSEDDENGIDIFCDMMGKTTGFFVKTFDYCATSLSSFFGYTFDFSLARQFNDNFNKTNEVQPNLNVNAPSYNEDYYDQ